MVQCLGLHTFTDEGTGSIPGQGSNKRQRAAFEPRTLKNFTSSSQTQGASLGAQTVKNPPTVQVTQVRSVDQDDPLEKGMATHSSMGEFPWTEEPGGLQSMGSQRVRHD